MVEQGRDEKWLSREGVEQEGRRRRLAGKGRGGVDQGMDKIKVGVE